jgi:hypothetical protein
MQVMVVTNWYPFHDFLRSDQLTGWGPAVCERAYSTPRIDVVLAA